MPSTFVLTTPVTSGDPGQAAWTNTNALPGGVKFAQFAVFTSTGIPGSDTTLQPFDVDFTIPAGLLEAGDLFFLSFSMNVSVDGGGNDSFVTGVQVGGINSLTGVYTQNAGSSGGFVYTSTFGGVPVGGAAGSLVSGGISNEPPYGTGSVQVLGFAFFNVDTTVPVPVRVLWEWQAGAQAGSSAELTALQLQIIKQAP
jgi:hypothetical protein